MSVPASQRLAKAHTSKTLVETVLWAQALRGSARWSDADFDRLLSEEALTAAVQPRYFIEQRLNKDLRQILGTPAESRVTNRFAPMKSPRLARRSACSRAGRPRRNYGLRRRLPLHPGKRYLGYELPDPMGQSIEPSASPGMRSAARRGTCVQARPVGPSFGGRRLRLHLIARRRPGA